jgi:hypothetical protein
MAKVKGYSPMELTVTIELNEGEAGALDALFGYGLEPFLETFYAKMGRAYLEPYEKGLRSLHESRGFLSQYLHRMRAARRVFAGELVAATPESLKRAGNDQPKADPQTDKGVAND